MSIDDLLKVGLELQTGDGLKELAKTFDMDDTQKHFRENLEWLKSVFVDGFEVVKKLLEDFKTSDDIDIKEVILQDLEMELCKIDYANDFCKIGGLDVMLESLNNDEGVVKAGVAWVLGTIAQNNLKGQEYILEKKEVLEKLVDLLKNSEDNEVVKKVVYAISGLIKKNKDGLEKFKELDGFKGLYLHLSSNKNENIRSRILFLIQQIIINFEFEDIYEIINDLIPIFLSLIYDEKISLSIDAVNSLSELSKKGDNALTKLKESNLLEPLALHKERLESTEGNYEEEVIVAKSLLETIEKYSN